MGDQQMTQIQVVGDQKPLQRRLYDAVLTDNLELFDKELTDQQVVDFAEIPLMPGGNTVLHLAAQVGSKSITEHLATRFPDAFLKENDCGDTAFHMAVKSGQVETVRALLMMANSDNVAQLLRIVNHDNGNTALHEAVLHADKGGAIVRLLVSEDPEVAYLENFRRKSPLYLAVEKGELTILQLLLENLPPLDDGGRVLVQGMSPLYRAIELEKQDMLEEILNKRPEFIQMKEKNGRNALHYAAHLGNVQAIEFILQKNPNHLFERDEEGMYPLLIACESGTLMAFQTLVKLWPDPTQFFDHKHQNILHIAAKNGRDYVVRCILRDPKLAPNFINSQDIVGNTPLHLASMNGHSLVVGSLLLSMKANCRMPNEQGFTPYEVAKRRVPEIHERSKEPDAQFDDIGFSSKNCKRADTFDSMMTLSILFLLQLCHIMCGDRQTQRIRRLRKEVMVKRVYREEIKERVNSLLIVSTVIAGVAFSGITQMPEYKGEDQDKANNTKLLVTHSLAPTPHPSVTFSGISPMSGAKTEGNKANNMTSSVTNSPTSAPTQHRKSRFRQVIEKKIKLTYLQIYTFFDSMALDASILAAILLCAVQVVDDNLGSIFTWVASLLVAGSLYGLSIAFGFATLMGIEDDPKTFGFSTFLIVMEGLYVLLMTLIVIPLFFPLRIKYLLIRTLYVYLFVLYFLAHRCLDCCLRRHVKGY